MKIKEILAEGFWSGVGRGLGAVGKGLTQGATDIVAPGARAAYKSALQKKADDQQLTQKLDPRYQQAVDAIQRRAQQQAQQPQGYQPKPLSAFSQILPKHVSVTHRDPLVIRYGTQDFAYDETARRWENLKGNPVQDGRLTQLLTSWAEEINDFDPPPQPVKPGATTDAEPAVFASGRTVATVKTVHGNATKMRDGKWYLGNTPITNATDIANLDNEARATGQIK